MMKYLKIAGCFLLMIVLTKLGLKNSELRKKVAKKKAETEKLKHDVVVKKTKNVIIQVRSDIQKLGNDKKKNSLALKLLEEEQIELENIIETAEGKVVQASSAIKTASDALAYAERLRHAK